MSRIAQIVSDNILLSVVALKILLVVGVITITLVKVLVHPDQEDQHIKVILVEQNSYNQPVVRGDSSAPLTQEVSPRDPTAAPQHDLQDVVLLVEALAGGDTAALEGAAEQSSGNPRITQTTLDLLKVLSERSEQQPLTDVTWSGDALSEQAVLSLVSQYDWDHQEALDVSFCESGRNPNAIFINYTTRDYSIGLFQINLFQDLARHRPSVEWLLVPENNVAYAYKLWSEDGWRPWYNCAERLNLLP
ncbi:MAG: lytic transglycosylase domain-containing protein [Candidatus Spechtbacteria bacterium SB0662_bin_43]|uniref:Lytic transglycosylase domain-containing protein n=1 Tax=Candidatus Spechtbacteria bacterium SB0662_bin_43 TaxID=2604897 RepID=A0A845D9B5_9BACT|nr:lytic transglycosylase domain-containing protein [Candidatus Spechtbacteria bacterium SB0662_bin_43]